MIRHRPQHAELGLDSLTDTMTNMVGLILLMVAITSIVSGGMRITLARSLNDPGQRTPIHLMCQDRRVLLMQRGNQWKEGLAQACRELESRLGRKPTTGEALVEANTLGASPSPDCRAIYVREPAWHRGGRVYVIGIRFLASRPAEGVEPLPSDAPTKRDVIFSPSAAEAIASADPEREYVDAFVCEGDLETLEALQQRIQERKLHLSWRALDRYQNPGLSDFGFRSGVEEMK